MSQRSVVLLAIFSTIILFLVAALAASSSRSRPRVLPTVQQRPETKKVQVKEAVKTQGVQLRSLYARGKTRAEIEQERKERMEQVTEEIERQAFFATFQREIDKGCDSKAVFRKILWRWHVSVPEVGALSVAVVYPEDKNKIIRAVERIGAGDDVSFSDFCKFYSKR